MPKSINIDEFSTQIRALGQKIPPMIELSQSRGDDAFVLVLLEAQTSLLRAALLLEGRIGPRIPQVIE